MRYIFSFFHPARLEGARAHGGRSVVKKRIEDSFISFRVVFGGFVFGHSRPKTDKWNDLEVLANYANFIFNNLHNSFIDVAKIVFMNPCLVHGLL